MAVKMETERVYYADDDDDDDDDDRESAFLFQRLSVLIQRSNAILLNDSFES